MKTKLLLLALLAAIFISLSQMASIDTRLEAMQAECDEYNLGHEMLSGEIICDPAFFSYLESLTPRQQKLKEISDSYQVWGIVFWLSLGVGVGVVYRRMR